MRWWTFKPRSVVWHASLQYTLGSVLFVAASYFALFVSVRARPDYNKCAPCPVMHQLAGGKVGTTCRSRAVRALHSLVAHRAMHTSQCTSATRCMRTACTSCKATGPLNLPPLSPETLHLRCRWLFAYPYAVGSVMYTIGASLLLGVSWRNHPVWAHPLQTPRVRHAL